MIERNATENIASGTALADDLEGALRSWQVPAVGSEKELDRAVRDFIRAEIGRHASIPVTEVRQWVAGHGELSPYSRYWSQSKAYQSVCLWDTKKSCDLFVYHPEGKYGLPRRGISFEIKYVGPTGSYAGAVATVAGQLLAYSLRHERTIGFVVIGRPRRQRPTRTEADEDRSAALQKILPSNARLIVRFLD